MLQDHSDVIQLAQFLNVFESLFKFQQELPITPADIESALEHPELDPLCGEIVTKMLSRKLSRQLDDTILTPTVKYEVWNE